MPRWPSEACLAVALFPLVFSFPLQLRAAKVCAACHAAQVKGYARSAMAQSLRRPAKEPEGAFEHDLSGTKFTVYSNGSGFWQRRTAGTGRAGMLRRFHTHCVILRASKQ